VTGQSAHELFHVHSGIDDLTPETCPIRTVPLSGEVYSSRAEIFQRKDGSTLRVEVIASPLSSSGEISGSVVLFRDITAEYETQLRLQQTDIAFRNLSEAVMVTDENATVIALNRACTTITGYKEEEIMGQNPKILSSGRHDAEFYKEMWGSISSRGFWEGEIWNRRKGGEVYPEWLNITAVRSDSGELINYVGVFSDITELRRKEERLRDLAYHDQLTHLPNRAHFHELFEHALERARRHDNRLALLFLDLDRFKQINDTLGHVTGDTLLQQLGERIQECTRVDDDVARLGGDEFCVLLEDIDHIEDAARVARKLIEAIKEPFKIGSKDLYVTASIGISIFPEDGNGTTTLLKNADAAMYLAKNAGRNDFRYFTKAMADEAAERFQIEGELREALAGEQFELYYQPKVDISDGNIVGLEALIRWNHPEHGVVSPFGFLGVAQDAGIMEPITDWVVGSAAKQVSHWKKEGLNPGRVAVNIDTESFLKPELARRLVEIVKEEGDEPQDIELEVVEGSLAYEAHTTDLWQKLVSAGFVLSIDDFGTGESSLSRLKLLPVETLKVDQSFVCDVESSEDDRTIIRTIIAMGKSLGLKVLAEGVEEPMQLHFLREMGCDYVQGYYFTKPLPADAVTKLLKDNDYAELLQHQQ
jgi:diguanylate cyclase (GGDEF)-like protein/PAS domain S-box-containing protein